MPTIYGFLKIHVPVFPQYALLAYCRNTIRHMRTSRCDSLKNLAFLIGVCVERCLMRT